VSSDKNDRFKACSIGVIISKPLQTQKVKVH